jgi:hypothetical protein
MPPATDIAQLKKKYASITSKAYPAAAPRPVKEGAFTENERALLLRSVIDALRADANTPEFKIWHKHGLSRIYFADDSWLSYGTDGTPIYGFDKTGDAYRLRNELKLKKAKKEKLK